MHLWVDLKPVGYSEIVTYGFLVLLPVGFFILLIVRDRRYLKKSTRQSMRKELMSEINAERQKAYERKKKFEQELRKYQ